MRILCKNCHREIEVNPFQPFEADTTLVCNWCNTAFTLRPKEDADGFDIIFREDKRTVRSCINCGKKFYTDTTEAIPVCPTCKHEPSLKRPELNKYYVIKDSGKKLGPYFINELGSWVRDGLLRDNELIETPEKDTVKAGQILELGPYFKDFYSKIKASGKSKAKGRKGIRVIPKALFSTAIIIGILALAGGWLYLIFQEAPQKEIKREGSEELYEAWSGKYPELLENFEHYYKKGMAGLKTYTEKSCLTAKGDFTRAFIKSRGQASMLPFIALAASCIYDSQKDGKILDFALRLTEINISEASSPSNGYLAKADLLFKKGDMVDSKLFLDKALELTPDNPSALMFLGRHQIHFGKDEAKGKATLLKSLRSDQKLSQANLLIAQNALKQDMFGEALWHLNKRIKNSPNDPDALFKRANIYIKLKRYTAAREDLTKAVRLKSPFDSARILLAQIMFRVSGNTPEALRNVQITTRKGNNLTQTEKANAHLLLSSIFLEQDKLTTAMDECEKGLTIRPADPYLRLNKVRALLSAGMKDEAFPIIQEFLVSTTDLPDDVYLHLTNILEENNMKNEALDALVKYTKSKPKSFFPFVKIATNYISNNELKKAKRALLAGMNQVTLFSLPDFPVDLRAPPLNIDTKAIAKEFSEAAASTIGPDLVKTARAILKMQGTYARRSSRDVKNARYMLEKVTRSSPGLFHPHLALSHIYVNSGMITKAQSLLQKAQRLDINNTLAKIVLSAVYTKRKKLKEAAEELDGLLEEDWIRFLVLYRTAKIELARGNKDKAKETFGKAYKVDSSFYPTVLELSRLR